MKYVVLLPDGVADEPCDELGGLTPLEKAKTPHMDRLAAEGRGGTQEPIPKGMAPGSETGNLSVLGYDPGEYLRHCGRGPIEAAALGVALKDDEWALRMNLVRVDGQGRMADHSAGHITSEEAAPIVKELAAGLKDFAEFRFHLGKGYRHLAVTTLVLEGMVYSPPHSIVGEVAEEHYPRGPQAVRFRALTDKGRQILSQSRANTTRGEAAATDIWLWGAGQRLAFPAFREKYGVSGGVITAVDLPRGLARLVGLKADEVKGATGFTDTDYGAKVRAALAILEKADFVYLHVEAMDEMGHLGDTAGKVKAIEAFDEQVVGPMLKGLELHKEKRVLLTCDHQTPLAVKDHRAGAVPFVLWGDGIDADGVAAFSEKECAAKGEDIGAGHLLMSELVGI